MNVPILPRGGDIQVRLNFYLFDSGLKAMKGTALRARPKGGRVWGKIGGSMESTPHQSKPIALITAEIGWGSMKPAAEIAPQALLDAGLAERLGAKVYRVPCTPKMNESTPSYEETERIIVNHILGVKSSVVQVIQEGYFPVIIGGDHTSAIGFHAGLAEAFGELGIIWVDTHPDLNTLETSPSGHIHGMVLAALLGRGSDVMLEAGKACNTRDHQVAMIGTRDIDAGELTWLNEGNINCMTMDFVRRNGLKSAMEQAVTTATTDTNGFGLTIDIDVLDPIDAPFVATPVDGGIMLEELVNELCEMPMRDNMMGLEVTEYTPRSSDDDEAACDLVHKLITAALPTLV